MNFWPEPVGIGKVSSELADYLAGTGWDVTVVTGFPHQPNWQVYEEYQGKIFRDEVYGRIRIRRSCIYVPKRPTKGLMRPWRRIFSDTSMPITGIASALFCPRPDLVISIPTPLQAAAAAILLKTIWHCPILTWVQDLIPDIAVQTGMMRTGKALIWAQRLEMFVHRNSDRIAVISEGFQRNLQAKGVDAEKIFCLPNWIDVMPFKDGHDRDKTRRDFGLFTTDFVLTHIGSLAARTDAETLLNSMSILKKYSHIKLIFVGGGNLRVVVQEQAKQLGLDNICFLPGIPRREDLIALAEASDLLILSQRASITDATLPSKLLTYMASGRPVLASVNPLSEAARFICDSGGGVVTQAEDARSFAEAVLSLEQQPESRARMGEAGRRYIDQNFEYSQVLKRFEAELNSMINRS
jgi:colanic acid biosynthesis glycosyl transferase WcaI